MFKRIRNIFKKPETSTLIPLEDMLPGETAWEYYERAVLPKKRDLGDGKAVFFGEGTQEEYEQQQLEDQGMKGWYERLRNL